MRWVYDLIYAIACLLSSPLWVYKLLRTGKWRTDWAGRFGHAPARPPQDHRPTLLIHAVSVGEVDAIRLLVRSLHEQTSGQWRIAIAATTDTGHARACELFGHTHLVVRYPLDFSRAVHRLLNRVQPDLVALVELEVWPNFVLACDKRNIPVCVINGRLSERSFKRYRLIAPLLRPTFRRLAGAAVQTNDYASRFAALGVPAERVRVTDSMKWDTAELADHVDGADELAERLGIDRKRPLIVAGSTGPGEEQLLIETCPPEAQLLLAPRRPERFDEVAALAQTHGPLVRWSQTAEHGPPPAQAERPRLFLLDTIGQLKKAYMLADVAVVGRSFLGMFGSNALEPVALGKPTIIGPYHSDFADVIQLLDQAGGIVIADQPGPACVRLLSDPRQARALADNGRAAILLRQGATQRHVELLKRLMPQATRSQPPATRL